ncbi:LacI family transcriptional regulator [Halanaerobium saccharolyticum]|uniref:LacI family transcriptional regulator n=1 Tax=Halanaerobium saccharolyticum TaxID=43595 RepID=A0A4V6PTK4_9FIRM|nr:LacI family DNA-binding transcriptional regulator [Halanaerobium saccharolyticum]TDO84362.1 LacI family transcriptional regulator [Halanaerobium saccharolyticum]
MAATLKDIAKKAGVSITTVSRVINNKDSVIPIKDDTKNKVLEIAAELNYRPNINARSLSTKKSYNLGLILDYLDPYFSDIVNSIEKSSREKNYNLILSMLNNKSFEEIINNLLYQSSIEGILIGGTKKLIKKNRIFNKLKKLNVPIVLIAHYFNDIPSINIDDFRGGYLAAEHLIELGHQKIAIITGPDYENRKDSQQRLMGYKKAITENSIELREDYILEGNYSYHSGYQNMKKLLGNRELPTAVFAAEDQMALGALKAAYELGVRIPEDISLIGFDNIIQSRYSTPSLTTISQPRREMGRAAINLLVSLIENEKDEFKEQQIFTPKLISRESTCSI